MKRTKLAESYVLQVEESQPLPLLPITTARTFGIPINYQLENRLSIFKQESEIIREMAEKSDCAIVGRCADYVLHDMNPFKLFVYADMEGYILPIGMALLYLVPVVIAPAYLTGIHPLASVMGIYPHISEAAAAMVESLMQGILPAISPLVCIGPLFLIGAAFATASVVTLKKQSY